MFVQVVEIVSCLLKDIIFVYGNVQRAHTSKQVRKNVLNAIIHVTRVKLLQQLVQLALGTLKLKLKCFILRILVLWFVHSEPSLTTRVVNANR